MSTATDGIAWLAAPRSITFGGYGVVLARGLDSEELVTRPLPDCRTAGRQGASPRGAPHRTGLGITGRHFGLSLPRRQVLEDALPAVVLEIPQLTNSSN
ncbi:hypothetical protein GFH48_02420 [Streptomyces fagopyri]|uniref:Uncharacterized protein n=1 Tax=Streptomyces fagopyri TaxID=2662397 RepID=A0A5Q0L674_9ACTN|nr:hypothetical protein [Streptomyces fagopyri]QFZ72264.1 hypothetical protein GFH48_02420 [Streptomyces fagopyri]